jgi:phosphatidylglycerophosphatase A
MSLPPQAPTEGPAEAASNRPGRAEPGLIWAHPAHFIALGFGSGLSPVAPGTAGTLLAWLSYALLDPYVAPPVWAGILLGCALVGWWACTVTARNARSADPGFIVWDEILAFWGVLWILAPIGFWWQLIAFAVFRFFDAVKPGPVGWADRAFKGEGWFGGFGILFDDLVAAACTVGVVWVPLMLWPQAL